MTNVYIYEALEHTNAFHQRHLRQYVGYWWFWPYDDDDDDENV